MKILIVAHAIPPEGTGGTELYVNLVARGLAGRGHQVSVFCGSLEWKEKFEVRRFELDGLPVTRVHRSDLYFDHWDKIQNPHVSQVWEEELDRVQPDVVHVHHWIRLSFDLVRRAAARGIPVVVHLHDLFLTCPRVFRIREEDRFCEEPMGPSVCRDCVTRWSFQGDAEIEASLQRYGSWAHEEIAAASTLLAPSDSHGSYVQARLAARGTVETLPHPEFPDRRVAAGPSAESPGGQLHLLFFANLHPIKGAHVLLEACRRLGEDSGVSVELWGGFSTPEYEKRLRDLARGSVRFQGPYLPSELAKVKADAVVIPSLARESYSFWLDEAMALGHPILAAGRGALEERTTDRVVLFDPRNPEDLVQRIRELRDQPDLRARLRQAPSASTLGLAQHLDRLEQIYAQSASPEGSLQGGSLSDPRLEQFDWDRREAAFAELLRSEGWEKVLGDQGREIDRLQKALEEAEKKAGKKPDNPENP